MVKRFRFHAIRLLKYWISKGSVIIPTAIAAETNAATWGYPAPAFKRTPPNGKATKLGSSVIVPTPRESKTPRIPD